MKIYFVNGIGTAGKDTFVDYVIQTAEADREKIAKISTVDKVKEIALEQFGWDGKKDEKARKFLSTIRAAWGEFNNGPVAHVDSAVTEAEQCGYCAIFIMVREYPEMIKMQKLMGGQTINIIRSFVTPGPTEKAFLDMVPTNYEYDVTIYNDASIDEWKKVSRFFYEKRIKGNTNFAGSTYSEKRENFLWKIIKKERLLPAPKIPARDDGWYQFLVNINSDKTAYINMTKEVYEALKNRQINNENL